MAQLFRRFLRHHKVDVCKMKRHLTLYDSTDVQRIQAAKCTHIEKQVYARTLSLTWMATISTRRVVQDDNTGQVIVYYRQVFNITT